jgi:hypothetical protein
VPDSGSGSLPTPFCQDAPGSGTSCSLLRQFGCSNDTRALAVDGDWLLSSDTQLGVVLHSLTGAAPPRTLSPTMTFAVGLHDGFAYWFEDGVGAYRGPLDGGAPMALATVVPLTVKLAVNSTHLYWLQLDFPQDTIKRASLSTGAVEVVFSGPAEVTSIAVDDSTLYWSNISNGSILSLPLDGGATSVLFSGQHSPDLLTLVDGMLYWSEFSVPGAIRRGPASGGAPQLVVNGLDFVQSFTTDGTTLYGLVANSGSHPPYLFKVPAAGGAAQPLFTLNNGGLIALGPTTLYLANAGLWALPR